MSLLETAGRSLRGRLALGLGAGSLLVLTVSFVALHLLVRHELYGQLDEDLRRRMHAVAEYAIEHPGRENVAEFMPQFRTRSHQDFFQIWDAEGRTLVRSDSSAGRDMPRPAEVAVVPGYRDLVLPDGHRGRAVAQTFGLPAGDPRRAITVITAEEVENLEAIEARIHVLLLAVALATVAALLLIATYSVGRGLAPVADFTRALEGVDLDDPRAMLDTGPLPSELKPAATSFSALLNRLLAALARERRYARNVAHELRSPLAEIRLLAEVGVESPDAGECRAAMRDVGAAAREMEQTVESLLALTRYQAGLESPQPEPLDLCAELQRQLRALAGAARQRGLSIATELPAELWVHTDSALVSRLLANLLGNAVSHAPPGATLRVELSDDGELAIANPAPHLRPEDVPRLGERFLRVQNGNHDFHVGLGLSLAMAVASVLGLTLTLDLRGDGTLVARVAGLRRLSGAPVAG